MTLDESKLEILKKVENGILSVEEGADLLAILDGGSTEKNAPASEPQAEVLQGSAVGATQMGDAGESRTTAVPAGWKSLWSIPMFLGILFMGLSGWWLFASYGRSGLGVGFWFALFFLTLSTGIVVLGWRLIAGRWLALNLTSQKADRTERVRFWVPLPLHFVDWAMRNFGQYMPEKVKTQDYVRILHDMDQSVPDGEPFQVDIDENDFKGEKTIEINFS